MKQIVKVVFVIIGTIIGAGFASGKEIYLFFERYQIYGIIGILISSILMGILIYKVLKISQKKNLQHYQELICYFCSNKKIGDIIQTIVQIFLLISFYIMVAGFSAYFWQQCQIPNYIGTAIMIILCYIIFMGNIERLTKLNTVLVPILILSILFLILQNIDAFILLKEEIKTTSQVKAILDAICYTSYNSIVLIPILLPLGKSLKQKSHCMIVATICAIILAILALSVFGLLLKIDIDITKLELPTVYIAGMMQKGYQILYGIVILVSIYTSAVSAGYGFLEKYYQNQKQYKKIVIIMCAIAFLVSNIGFSALVNLLYPIFGILGLIQMILILKKK